MSKEKWIEEVVANFEDGFVKEAKTRELDELLSKMMKNKGEQEVLLKLGDPKTYYLKNYSGKSNKNFNLIVGVILIAIGLVMMFLVLTNQENMMMHQVSYLPATRNNVFYGSGVVLVIGIITLINGLK